MAVLSTFTDAFNQNALSGTWSQFTAGSATFTYDSTGAQVNFPASSTSSTDGDISSVSSYDLTGSAGYIHTLAMPSSSTNADASFRLYKDGSNYLQWQYEAGTIYAQSVVGGVQSNLSSATYNSSTHAYLKISESGGTITWAYSSDGSSYSTLTTLANPFVVTAMKVLLAGTCYKNETSPGTFKWNNFNVIPSATASSGLILFYP